MYFISNIHEQFEMLSSVAITTSTANRCYSAIRNVYTIKKSNHLKREYCTNFTAFCCLGAAPNFTREKLKLRDCLWYEIVRNLAQTFIILTALRLRKPTQNWKNSSVILEEFASLFMGLFMKLWRSAFALKSMLCNVSSIYPLFLHFAEKANLTN